VDIFRSARKDGNDKKHEYLFHSQGTLELLEDEGSPVKTSKTDELSSTKGDLVGYDYFKDKQAAHHEDDFIARFTMPSLLNETLNVNLWMKGNRDRTIFNVKAPYSRALHKESVPEQLYHKSLPTLVVRQKGEARSRPFVGVIDAFNKDEGATVEHINYFSPENDNPYFVGISVRSKSGRIDRIFNDENSETLNTFSDGNFQGTYGIASFLTEELKSLFLGNGKLLEKGLWSVETSEDNGTVLVLINQKGLKINAHQPFKLTMPVPKSAGEQINLHAIGPDDKGTFSGKIFTKNNQKIAEFQLPELENIQFELKSDY
jgi:hypothetical protein